MKELHNIEKGLKYLLSVSDVNYIKAVVNKDVPENVLVGGVPAKVIRENIFWE